MQKNNKIILIMLTAMNLRLSVTAVTPLFNLIQRDLKVDSTITALLVTIPLLCFSVGAVLAPWLNRKFGLKPLLITSSGLLVLANLFRPINTTTLLIGTFFIGCAIALLNVLVPVMISQTVSDEAGTTKLTSYYSVTMNVIGALGTAAAIPLATVFGWENVLKGFAIPAALTYLASLLSNSFTTKKHLDTVQESLVKTLLHDKKARKLIIFMGLQSLIFYSLISWLPSIYQAFGASESEAGLLLSVFQFIGIPAALALNFISNKKHLLWGLLIGYLIGLGFILLPHFGWWISAIVLGFTASLIFSTALNFIATSSSNLTKIANRSALAQSLGYLLAAVGPIIFGRLHDIGNWQIVLGVLLLLMIATIIAGFQIIRQK